jgi:hypothetical protein
MKPYRVLLLVLVAVVLLAGMDAMAAPKVKVSHTARQARPVQLGTSGGSVVDKANGYCCSGTLGALVVDAAGNQYILSNTHVFAGDSVVGGNGVVSSVGDPVNQPGFVDVNCGAIATDYVADLTAWAEIVPDGYSTVDAAVALVRPGMVDPAGKILEIGTISALPRAAFVNQQVKKSGRTSGLTTGKVAGLNATISVQYSDECAGASYVSTFTGQILVSPGKFLKAGDSGSLMVENVATNPRPVGLLYAGSSQVAIANPIQAVLDEFGMTMVGVGTTGAAATTGDSALPPGLAKASSVKERNSSRLMAQKGAVGHAVGLSKDGKKPVILLLVEQATPAVLEQAPKEIDGVAVEVMEVGVVVAL